MSFIDLKNIVKKYGDFIALKNLHITIDEGEIVSILGANGAGKSTTIKILCGLLKPTQGSLNIDNKDYESSAEKIKKMIGYVPEESAMYMDISVRDYLLFFGRLYGIKDAKTIGLMRHYFKELDLKRVENKRISELSKGMRRKVLITRALIHDPKIMIFDEPASGLDPQVARTILEFIKKMKQEGKTIIFSSHNLGHVQQIAERVIIIKEGNKISDTSLEELLKHQEEIFIITYNDNGVQKTIEKRDLSSLMQEIKDHDKIISIEKKMPSLEEIYLQIMN